MFYQIGHCSLNTRYRKYNARLRWTFPNLGTSTVAACIRTDQSAQQASTAILARTNAALLVRDLLVTSSILFPKIGIRDYADCTVPPQFSQRVKSALNAEPRSVKLASLVGSGGLWYGYDRLDNYQAKELSDVLTKVRQYSPSLYSMSSDDYDADLQGEAHRRDGPSAPFRRAWSECRRGPGWVWACRRGLPRRTGRHLSIQ